VRYCQYCGAYNKKSFGPCEECGVDSNLWECNRCRTLNAHWRTCCRECWWDRNRPYSWIRLAISDVIKTCKKAPKWRVLVWCFGLTFVFQTLFLAESKYHSKLWWSSLTMFVCGVILLLVAALSIVFCRGEKRI
jgi:hypothetical protein